MSIRDDDKYVPQYVLQAEIKRLKLKLEDQHMAFCHAARGLIDYANNSEDRAGHKALSYWDQYRPKFPDLK